MPKFHQEICKIKDIFIKNGYSERFLDKCVKAFLNKVFIPKRIIQTAEKKQVTIVLPYTGIISTELKVKYFSVTSRIDSWKSSKMSEENIENKLNQTGILHKLLLIIIYYQT